MRKKIVVIFFIICIFSVAVVSFELSASRTTSKAKSAEETRFNPTRRVNKEAVLEGNLTGPLQSMAKNASSPLQEECIVKTPEAWEKKMPVNLTLPFPFNSMGHP